MAIRCCARLAPLMVVDHTRGGGVTMPKGQCMAGVTDSVIISVTILVTVTKRMQTWITDSCATAFKNHMPESAVRGINLCIAGCVQV